MAVQLAERIVKAQLSSMVWAGSHSGHAGFSAAIVLMLIPFSTTPVDAALWAAAFRALLQPEGGRFAYLKFGSVELRLTGLLLLATMTQTVLLVIVTTGPLFLDPDGAFLTWYLKQQHQFLPWIFDVGTLMGALALVRFMMTPAILVDQNRNALSESWRLTRSIFWSLAMLILAWLVLRIAAGQLVGALVHTVSDVAAARGANWLTFAHPRGVTTATLPSWMSIPSLMLMTTGAALDALSIVVIAGIVTYAYGHATVSAEPPATI